MQYCEAVLLQLKINKFEVGKEKKCVWIFFFFLMLSISFKAENKKERNILKQKGNKNRNTAV